MSVHYSPGSHPVAVTPHGFAVLAGDTSPALASRIHALVADGRGLGGVLEALTGAYGTSLAAVPPFAVALAERGSVRLAVRGRFELDIEAATPERISGEGVTTWTERVIPEVSRVSLVIGADAAPAEYPVNDGVVMAQSLVWVPGADTAPEPAPAVASVPVVPEPREAAAESPLDAPEPDPETTESASDEPEQDTATPASPPVADSAAAVASAPVVTSAPPAPQVLTAPVGAPPGLIDSAAVLSLVDADTLLPADSTFADRDDTGPTDEHEAQPQSEWEATVVRATEAIAPAVVAGDHDGATISLAEARALRGADSAPPASAPPRSPEPPPLAPPRSPAPGRIRVSTGQVMTLDRTVVIGRRPRSTRVSGTDLPHLVAVDSPQQDISRSHVELRVEGDSIVATDLHTTNGTTLLRPGVDPMRLHPGEGTVIVPGDVIDLGDGITVAIEELP